MKPKYLAGLLSLGLGLTGMTAIVDAANFKLSNDQLAAAVEHGKQNYDKHPTAFMWSYLHDAGYGYPTVLMRTEYLAVADYVRRSEFQRKYGSQRVHKLTPERIESARSEVGGNLQFQITIYGPTEDFMKGYNFHLKVGDKTMKPANVDKPVVGENSGFKGKLAYKAQVFVDFDTKDLSGKEKVTLVLDPPKGMGPSGSRDSDFEVPFDLASVQ